MPNHYFLCSTDYIRYCQHQHPSSLVFPGCLSTGNRKKRLENVQQLCMTCFKEQKQDSEWYTTIFGGQVSDGFFVKFLRVQTDITSIIKHVKLLQVLRIQLNKCRCCLIAVPALCVGRNSAMESKVLTDAYLQPHATLGQQNIIFINWMGADKTTND